MLGYKFLPGLVAACCLLLWGSHQQSSILREASASSINMDQNRALRKNQHPSFDGFNTPSVKCRLELEQWQNDNIERWMQNPPYPLVEWVWKLTDDTSNSTYYKVLLNVLNHGDKTKKRTNYVAEGLRWQWQDQFGNVHRVGKERIEIQNVRQNPRLYFRLDVADNQTETPRPVKLWPTEVVVPTTKRRSRTVAKVPIEYDLEPYLQCNQVERENAPPPEVKIGACITRFWGQHDLMQEWIAYHRMIGIQHFWFFVSEPFENIYDTMPRHEQDITYIPYNYTWDAHKENGTQEMIETAAGWSAGGENWFQPMANNQCLMMAKQYGLDWVMTPDVDEYIVVHDPAITHFTSPSPLQQYLGKPEFQHDANDETKPRGQVCLNGGGYGKHPKLENDTVFELTIDFTYRKDRIYGNGELGPDGKGAGGRRKCFYNPKVIDGVDTHGKHGRWRDNLKDCVNTTEIELYHFRSPLLGPVEAAEDQLASYPELRDMYRDKLKQEMKRLDWALPKFDSHVCQNYTCDGWGGDLQPPRSHWQSE